MNPSDPLFLWSLLQHESQQCETHNQLVQNKAGLIQRPADYDEVGM